MYSSAHPRDYPACSGCSLCRLVCPMWRQRRDPRFSPEGIAKARQNGAAAELARGAGRLHAVRRLRSGLPGGHRPDGMIMDLRRELEPPPDLVRRCRSATEQAAEAGPAAPPAPCCCRAPPCAPSRICWPGRALLGLRGAEDDGADLAVALEIGGDIDPLRLRRFLAGLDGRSLVVGDGLLLAHCGAGCPVRALQGLGEALGNLRRSVAVSPAPTSM
jgi:hypothetical protein